MTLPVVMMQPPDEEVKHRAVAVVQAVGDRQVLDRQVGVDRAATTDMFSMTRLVLPALMVRAPLARAAQGQIGLRRDDRAGGEA